MSFVEKFEISTRRQLTDDELAELNSGLAYGDSDGIGARGADGRFSHSAEGAVIPRGLDRTLGMVFTSVGPKRVEGRIVIDDRHLQPWGVTNGGVYCAIGESIASIAGFIAAGGEATVMGVNNNTDFVRPSRPGDVLRAIARPVNLGRTFQVWEVLIANEETEKLVARTNLRTSVIDPSSTSRQG